MTQRLAIVGPLRVGGSHVPSKSILPACLTVFRENHPLGRLIFQTGSSRNIEQFVQNSMLDIGVLTHPSFLQNLEYTPFRQERIVLFVPARHPFRRKKALSLAEVAKEPLIVHRGINRGMGETTLNILKYMEDQGHTPNVLMECSSGEAVKASVMGGAGIGILMEGHLQDDIQRREVKVLKIRDLDDVTIDAVIIYQKRKPLCDKAQEFVDLLKRTVGGGRLKMPRPVLGHFG